MITVLGGCHVDNIRYSQRYGHAADPKRTQARLGGVAANIAGHMRRAHKETSPLRLISACAMGDAGRMNEFLSKEGIPGGLFLELEGESPFFTCRIGAHGEVLEAMSSTALYEAVTPDLLLPHLEPPQGALVVDANFPAETIAAAVNAWQKEGKVFAAGTSAKKTPRFERCLGRLDGIVLNRKEAGVLAEPASVEEMARALAGRMRKGAFALVSDGPYEAALVRGDEAACEVPPDKWQVRNTNGAGDVMAAELFFSILRKTMTLDELLASALEAGAHRAGV